MKYLKWIPLIAFIAMVNATSLFEHVSTGVWSFISSLAYVLGAAFALLDRMAWDERHRADKGDL